MSHVGAGTFVAPQVTTRGRRRAAIRRAGAAAPVDGESKGEPAPASLAPRPGPRRADPRRLYDDASTREAVPFDFRPCVPDLERLSYESWRRSRRAGGLERAGRELRLHRSGGLAGAAAGDRELSRARARRRVPGRGDRDRGRAGPGARPRDAAARRSRATRVLVEDPHYLGARRVFEAAGARLVGAPIDAEGIDLSGLSRARLDRCRLAYVTPSHQFPTGVVLSLARRQELLAWAGRANAFVLEDDYDSEFRYAGRAIAALKSLDDGDRVLYVGTFSKTLLPALRIAYVVLPPSLFEVFRSAKWLADWASPGFEQAVLERFLASGDFERHLRRARTRYAESRDVLLESIERELAPWSPGLHDSRAGLHLLLRFPELSGDTPVRMGRGGASRGLGLYPVAPCHLERPPAALAFVMGFARLAPEAIRRGVRELGRLLAAEARCGRAQACPARRPSV